MYWWTISSLCHIELRKVEKERNKAGTRTNIQLVSGGGRIQTCLAPIPAFFAILEMDGSEMREQPA